MKFQNGRNNKCRSTTVKHTLAMELSHLQGHIPRMQELNKQQQQK